MPNTKYNTSCKIVRRWVLLGIPIIFIVGSLMHFVYDWSGNLKIVGIFAPVNESVWEHLKLGYWPILIWWIVGYFILGRKNISSVSQWFVSCVVAELSCLLFIISFFYSYTGAFGIESLILDILSFFLGVTIGQITALHIYTYAKTNFISLFLSKIILVLLALAFVVFTFAPPHIPIFMDPITNQYGIQ